MAAETAASIATRRVARAVAEGGYINTINLAWRVTFDFVWYPGATTVAASYIDSLVPNDASTGKPREIHYTWQRDGGPEVRQLMNSGRITINLPPGRKGKLTVFDTVWEVSRVATGTTMSAANTLRGLQQRLNRLGYHLRRPGNTTPGIDGSWGRLTEIAVVQFQVDYVAPAGAPPAAANRLMVRGEWTTNTDPAYRENLWTYNGSPTNAAGNKVYVANPSTADAASLSAALQAQVGA
jgi:hypothetical protein